jgi:hypothetical protein
LQTSAVHQLLKRLVSRRVIGLAAESDYHSISAVSGTVDAKSRNVCERWPNHGADVIQAVRKGIVTSVPDAFEKEA